MIKTATIFEDPLTRKTPEGKAQLIQKVRTDVFGPYRLELWSVRFLVDPVTSVVERHIRVDDIGLRPVWD